MPHLTVSELRALAFKVRDQKLFEKAIMIDSGGDIVDTVNGVKCHPIIDCEGEPIGWIRVEASEAVVEILNAAERGTDPFCLDLGV